MNELIYNHFMMMLLINLKIWRKGELTLYARNKMQILNTLIIYLTTALLVNIINFYLFHILSMFAERGGMYSYRFFVWEWNRCYYFCFINPRLSLQYYSRKYTQTMAVKCFKILVNRDIVINKMAKSRSTVEPPNPRRIRSQA